MAIPAVLLRRVRLRGDDRHRLECIWRGANRFRNHPWLAIHSGLFLGFPDHGDRLLQPVRVGLIGKRGRRIVLQRLCSRCTALLHDHRPRPRRCAQRQDAVAPRPEVILRRRPVGHRPGIVERIGAHRAADRGQPHGCHRGQRPRPRKRAPCHSCLNHAAPSKWRDPSPTGWRRPPQRRAFTPSTGRHVPDLISGCSPSPTPTIVSADRGPILQKNRFNRKNQPERACGPGKVFNVSVASLPPWRQVFNLSVTSLPRGGKFLTCP